MILIRLIFSATISTKSLNCLSSMNFDHDNDQTPESLADIIRSRNNNSPAMLLMPFRMSSLIRKCCTFGFWLLVFFVIVVLLQQYHLDNHHRLVSNEDESALNMTDNDLTLKKLWKLFSDFVNKIVIQN